MSEIVPNIVHFKSQYKKVVHELIEIRKQAGQTQANMADWLKVDRRKIIAFEGLKKVDLETMLIYSDKLSVDVKLIFEVN